MKLAAAWVSLPSIKLSVATRFLKLAISEPIKFLLLLLLRLFVILFHKDRPVAL